jgi:Outer membrane protein beta-barrel domain
MKKTIALLLILVTLQAKAQLQLGISTSGYKSQAYNKQDDSMPNVHLLNTIKGAIGINALYNITPRIAIGTELSYFTSGQKYQCDSFLYLRSNAASLKLNYLQIPLYVQFNLLNPNNKLNLHIQVGGYYGNLLSVRETQDILYPVASGNVYKLNVVQNNKTITGTLTKRLQNGTDSSYTIIGTTESVYYKATDYGVHSAIGASYKLNPKFTLFGNFFYKYGLAEIEKTEPVQNYGSNGAPSNLFTIKYEYPFKYAPINNNKVLLRSKTNNINFGLQIGVLYRL